MSDDVAAPQPSEIVELYAAAWNEHDEGARRALLQRCWADDGAYADPTAIAEGRDALVAHIGGFHERMRGSSIALTSGVDAHHGWLRFTWRMLDAGGTPVTDGIDFGELGPDGRLVRIVGFFGPPPA